MTDAKTSKTAAPKPDQAHTELRRRGEDHASKTDTGAATALKPRSPLDAIPDPVDDDALDDLFNDMPV